MSSYFTRVFVFILSSTFLHGLPIEPRLSLANDWNSYNYNNVNGPGSYSFGYDLEDPKTGNVQYRLEEMYPNGTVIGSYGLAEPDGNIKVVKYIADSNGYRATVEDSSQKHPRYHPPRTSRPEDQRYSEVVAQPPSLNFLKALPLGGSVQEVREPPKYQDWQDSLYHNSLFNFQV